MDEKRKDAIFYVCTMIEYVARVTNNRRRDIIKKLSKKNIEHQLRAAEVNHCLSYEQVSDEWIEQYEITTGDFNSINECKYEIPSFIDIGRVYQQLILATLKANDEAQAIIDVFSSFISDEISDFNSSVYYSNPDYIRCSYEEGILLG